MAKVHLPLPGCRDSSARPINRLSYGTRPRRDSGSGRPLLEARLRVPSVYQGKDIRMTLEALPLGAFQKRKRRLANFNV
jgi:hypothetical protein